MHFSFFLEGATEKVNKTHIFLQLCLKEADTLKSSSIPIYYWSEQGFYTQNGWHDALLIKCD